MPKAQIILALVAALTLVGCANNANVPTPASRAEAFSTAAEYTIGPGDQLEIFVWRNTDLTVKVPVRPDGRISMPLVQDIQAAGKTSNQLAGDIKTALARFVKDPVVTVIIQGVQGSGDDRISVVGEGMPPRSVNYHAGLTVLDVMVEIGGLKEFAAGNRAKLLRRDANGVTEIPLHLTDLLVDGDQSANVALQPGDVIRIPERWF
jgi:polysaccharide export outer membrane protein